MTALRSTGGTGSRAPRSLGRRVFEVCGVAPLGVYAIVHVASYAQVLWGGDRFGAASFRGLQVPLEVLLVWVPWLFHAAYGAWLSFQPLPEDPAEKRGSGLLRATATLGLVFVVGHVAWLRAPIWEGSRTSDDIPQMLAAGLSATWRGIPAVAAAHLAGLAAIAAHLGVGLMRFCMQRELLTEPAARNLSWAIALLLFSLGAASVLHLATGDFPPHFLY